MAVARIEVVVAVSREAQLLEEVLAEPVETAEGVVGPPGRLGRLRQRGEAPEVLVDIQIGLLAGGDQERGVGQVDLVVRAIHRHGERGQRRVGVHQHPGAWWMPAVRSAAPCSSSASASVRAEARRAASCVSGVVASLSRSERPSW